MERKLEESLEQEYIRIQNSLQSKIKIPGKWRVRNFSGEETSMTGEGSEKESYYFLAICHRFDCNSSDRELDCYAYTHNAKKK